MKNLKFLFLALSLICCTAMSYGQGSVQTYTLTAQTQAGVYKATPDTLSNTDTTYLRIAPLGTWTALTEFGDVLFDWSVVPSISGTTTGTVVVQGSNTGTFARYGTASANDWVTLTSSTAEYNGSSSISITGSTTIYGKFILTNNQFKYLRVVYLAATTQTSVITGRGYLRKHGG